VLIEESTYFSFACYLGSGGSHYRVGFVTSKGVKVGRWCLFWWLAVRPRQYLGVQGGS